MIKEFVEKNIDFIKKISLYIFIFWIFPLLFSLISNSSILLIIFYTHVISIIDLIVLVKFDKQS